MPAAAATPLGGRRGSAARAAPAMSAADLVAALEDALRRSTELDAPLDARMAVIRDAVRALSTTFAEAVDRLVARLEAAEAGANAPRPGEPMPSFVLPDQKGRLVRLEELTATGPLAIAFHRGHWCPYCRLNTVALAEVEREIAAEGGRIVAIAPDRRRYAAQLQAESGGSFPVLTDMDNAYAMSLNLAIWVGAEMQEMICGAGWDLARYQGNPAWMLPVPATFVLGRDGIVTARYVDPDYRRRMDVEALVAAMRQAAHPGPVADQRARS